MRLRLCFLAASALIVSAIIDGCNPIAPDHHDFVIKVDSVTGPSAVSGGIPFNVKVSGFVGGNGCFHFQEFRVDRATGTLDVTVIGRREGDSRSLCTQNIVFLEGQPLTISPPILGPFALRFHQPDNTILTKTVYGE